MTTSKISRRTALARTSLLAAAAMAARKVTFAAAAETGPRERESKPFLFCLNTATIRGQKLGIVKELELAARAGYDAIEPWVDSVQEYVKGGGDPGELRRRAADAGLSVEGAIGFPEWLAEDEVRRAKGMDRARREMDLMAQIGAKRFACPPAGATELPKLDLLKIAERYLAVLQAGEQSGLLAQLELWGFSKNLSRMSECVAVAMETGHPKACVLADVFHLHKGGSPIQGVGLLAGPTIQVLHMNDYPSDPPREKIDDSYRVYPGDGTAPLSQLLRLLHEAGGQKVLSLELFNRKYWAEDPLEVAKAGLAKMRAAAQAALA